MKGLLRKSIIVMVMLAMMVQMTGSAFAASVEWAAGGKYYTAYVNKGAYTEKIVDVGNIVETHIGGTITQVIIPSRVTVYSNGVGINFGSTSYASYLYQALALEKLSTQTSYTVESGTIIFIPSEYGTGEYKLVQKFSGYSGTWEVKSATSEEAAKMHVEGGSFSYAPTGSVGLPYFV